MTKFTIVCENNSDARNYSRSLGRLEALSIKGGCKHNGGKTVVAIVAPENAAAVESLLEASRAVRSFEMTDA